MSVFAMADLHLPLSVNKPMDIFGSRWQDYVNKIKKNWCAVVSDGDTVIISFQKLFLKTSNAFL